MRSILTLATLLFASTIMATELVMVEAPGCVYCEKWKKEVGVEYDKTELGREAPLRKVQKEEARETLELARPVIFTPTFIFVEDNVEFARLEGYQSEDFFWALGEEILAQHKQSD